MTEFKPLYISMVKNICNSEFINISASSCLLETAQTIKHNDLKN